MKRRAVLNHFKENECLLDREGAKHSIIVNTKTGAWTSMPRHSDIREITVMKMCKELGIPKP